MGPLAKAAGLARATLYLYFPSREEVLLELYLESARAWTSAIERSASPGMSPADFLDVFYDVSFETPLFLELAPRLAATIEVNVSPESLIAGKRMNAELAQRLVVHTSLIFSLSLEQSAAMFTGLFALLIGSIQIMTRPNVDLDPLPEDVREMMTGLDSKALFLTNGVLLMKGSQASVGSSSQS